MTSNGYIFTAIGENFDQLVINNSRRGLVLVEFWSPKAGPSLRQREMLTRLTRQLGGRVLLATVNTDEQKQLEDRLAQRPDDQQTRYRLASVLLVGDDYEGALEQLVILQRTAPDFRGGIARKGLMALFNMLDSGDGRVKQFRAELFNLSH